MGIIYLISQIIIIVHNRHSRVGGSPWIPAFAGMTNSIWLIQVYNSQILAAINVATNNLAKRRPQAQ
jgi:hypothetical protein